MFPFPTQFPFLCYFFRPKTMTYQVESFPCSLEVVHYYPVQGIIDVLD